MGAIQHFLSHQANWTSTFQAQCFTCYDLNPIRLEVAYSYKSYPLLHLMMAFISKAKINSCISKLN